jgi:ABC-type phosphate transport system permease subunit
MNRDIDHLKLLGIFHLVWGVLSILFGLAFGLFYIAFGAIAANGANGAEVSGNLPDGIAGMVFIVLGVVIIVISAIYGIMMIVAGGMFRKQRSYGFCFFISILDLFGFPSLVLGIFALIVLVRPTAKELFESGGVLPSGTSPQTIAA